MYPVFLCLQMIVDMHKQPAIEIHLILYLVNCAICHGTNLDGNGPLWKGGDGPYPAAPRNLKDDYSKKLPDGQMYHVIMYGKGQMGSYASQVHPEQRWWIVKYIREKQGTGGST